MTTSRPPRAAFVIYGECMSVTVCDAPAVDDIDEALRHLSLVPANQRGAAWHAYLDAILEQRSTHER